jgi:hypothetical protein
MEKILLVDADSVIPNLALMKLSAYHKLVGNSVELLRLGIPYYPNRKKIIHNIPSGYDVIYCSVVFEGVKEYVKGEGIIFGGTGHSLSIELPEYIEQLQPDYSIYPDNDTSYGFISRGCIRNCYFCKVPEKEGYIRQVNTVDNIVRHKKVKFLDNNILALPNHKEILRELIDKNIKCQFNQGLDIRLVDEENSVLLSNLRYIGEYIFAFDDWAYLKQMERKLPLLSWRRPWQLKFFVYCNPNMELDNITNRVEYLKDRECLPYLMRDITCWESENRHFYTDIAAWCNQPHLFKNMTFPEFLRKRHTTKNSKKRIASSEALYIGP